MDISLNHRLISIIFLSPLRAYTPTKMLPLLTVNSTLQKTNTRTCRIPAPSIFPSPLPSHSHDVPNRHPLAAADCWMKNITNKSLLKVLSAGRERLYQFQGLKLQGGIIGLSSEVVAAGAGSATEREDRDRRTRNAMSWMDQADIVAAQLVVPAGELDQHIEFAHL